MHNMEKQDPLAVEKQVMEAILRMGCRHFHRTGTGLCPDCGELLSYSRERLAHCLHGPDKPSCAACTVHCYKPEMRRRIREIMGWAGPRMILRHPVITLKHLGDLLKKNGKRA